MWIFEDVKFDDVLYENVNIWRCDIRWCASTIVKCEWCIFREMSTWHSYMLLMFAYYYKMMIKAYWL